MKNDDYFFFHWKYTGLGKTTKFLREILLILNILGAVNKMSKVLAISKITQSNQLTLFKEVREKLKVKADDKIVFFEDSNGRIYIQKQ